MRASFLSLLVGLVTTGAMLAADYEKDVVPILRTYCAGCHNDADFEGEFSVETYAAFREGGENKGDPITPGDAEKSYLVGIMEGTRRPRMPPKDEPHPSETQIDLLRQWISEGAKGPKDDASIFATLDAPEIAVQGQLDEPITALASSPDGRFVAEARYRSVSVRTARGKRVLHAFTELPGKVAALSFSPDSKRLVAATGITGLSGTAVIWDLESGTPLHELGGHRDLLYQAVFSPDGKLIATAGYDRSIRIWNSETGELERTIDGHNGAVIDLAFHPDGQVIASASADETVKLWRLADGVRLDTLNQPQGGQNAVAFTQDGRFVVAAGADSKIRLWKLTAFDKPRIQPIRHSRFAHEGTIEKLALTEDGRHLLSAADDGTLKSWSMPGLIEEHAYELQPDLVTGLALSSGKRNFLVSRMDGSTATYPLVASDSTVAVVDEQAEPTAQEASRETLVFKGVIEEPGTVHLHPFTARKGEEILLEIKAASSKSKLDSRIEVLDAEGQPIVRTVLQAVRDSWVTFRGKDSKQSNDFRIHNWEEMELGQYLYLNGEVIRLWLYPRGPDSGFNVFPGFGSRHAYFGTSGRTHALNQPCYIVEAHDPSQPPPANGLPRYELLWENDDDSLRKAGRDSRLYFVAPKDGEYQVRVSDVRSFGGKDHHYELVARAPLPSFKVSIDSKDKVIMAGAGHEFGVTLDRIDGYQGPVSIAFEHLPPGFHVSTPLIVEAEQYRAYGVIWTDPDAPAPSDDFGPTTATATAHIRGREVVMELKGGLGNLTLGERPKVALEILPGSDPDSFIRAENGRPLTLVIERGGTLQARVRAVRNGYEGEIPFGKEDAGRNLPFGTIVDNIGLNGLLLLKGESERDIFLRTAPFAEPGERLIHLRTTAADKTAAPPVILSVVER